MRCFPGDTWDYDDQNGGGWGWVVVPPPGVVEAWVESCVNAEPDVEASECGSAEHCWGGWYPSRSACVLWDKDSHLRY